MKMNSLYWWRGFLLGLWYRLTYKKKEPDLVRAIELSFEVQIKSICETYLKNKEDK